MVVLRRCLCNIRFVSALALAVGVSMAACAEAEKATLPDNGTEQRDLRPPSDRIFDSLRSKPVAPVVDGECDGGALQHLSAAFAPALGLGPVYVAGTDAEGALHLDGARRDAGGYYFKVLWIAHSDFPDVALIRGQAQVAGHDVRFEDGITPASELRIGPPGVRVSAATPGSEGWYLQPSFLRVQGPGCAHLQIIGQHFEEFLRLKIVP